MQILRRITLFLLVNILVVLTLSAALILLGFQPYFTARGLDYNNLMAFCFLWGMGGALISLALSRIMARMMMGVNIIEANTRVAQEKMVYDMVYSLSRKAGLPMPQVGIFNSAAMNAFATGPTKSRSLVAVSTGIIEKMTPDELEGVIGHEISHIANGDMVTMTLLQGVVNAFVMFFARALAFALSRSDNKHPENSPTYRLLVFVFQMIFMALGAIIVCAFSRWREFRADKGGADLSSKAKMIAALTRLQKGSEAPMPAAMQKSAIKALMINSKKDSSILHALFSTHPPLEERIARLKNG